MKRRAFLITAAVFLIALSVAVFVGCFEFGKDGYTYVVHFDSNGGEACSALAYVSMSDDITSIGSNAFYNCNSLVSVTIPGGVTRISSNAFYYCNSLAAVFFENVNGWRAGTTSLSTSSLENTATAADYLRSSYTSATWTRS